MFEYDILLSHCTENSILIGLLVSFVFSVPCVKYSDVSEYVDEFIENSAEYNSR